jgi:hypothetical protein
MPTDAALMAVTKRADRVRRERERELDELARLMREPEHRPCSARQVYYRAVVAGLIAKDGAGSRANESKVGRVLNELREGWLRYRPGGPDHWLYARYAPEARALQQEFAEEDQEAITETVCRMLGDAMPFGWITDNTRTRYQSEVWASKDAAINDMIRYYRRDLWRSQPRHVEVWCESDSIAGIIVGLCDEYGVPLLPCRGQAPKRFVYDSAQAYGRLGKPVTVLYVGDFDPCGLDIGNSVRDRISRYLPPGSGVEIDFQRIAITGQQVLEDSLPGHGLNRNIAPAVRERFLTECSAYGIPGEAVEAEAMPPEDLRDLVTRHILRHIDERQWELELAVEQMERLSLKEMLGGAA